jgi:hypothetical protein
MDQLKASTLEDSATSGHPPGVGLKRPARITVTVIAAVSVLTGGLAAAWYYRKDLARLQQAKLDQGDSNFGSGVASDDDGI